MTIRTTKDVWAYRLPKGTMGVLIEKKGDRALALIGGRFGVFYKGEWMLMDEKPSKKKRTTKTKQAIIQDRTEAERDSEAGQQAWWSGQE